MERPPTLAERAALHHAKEKMPVEDQRARAHEPPAEHTPAVGEYLSRIYTILREGRRVVGARLAQRLEVSPSAVTQALQRMTRSGFLTMDPDVGIQLTDVGRDLAESIVRRHYLIERLLVDALGFNWADADEEAERLEHALSTRLEEFLLQRLGYPATCPHGNPFPGSTDEERLLHARKLSEASPGERITIWRITEEGEDDQALLHFFHEHSLLPGTQVVVQAMDNRLLTLSKAGQAIALPVSWAQHVRISDAA